MIESATLMEQVQIVLVVAPGIWRHPDWIVDEIQRLVRRGYASNVQTAVELLCRRQRWAGHVDTLRDQHDRACEVRVWLTPSRALAQTHRSRIEVPAGALTWDCLGHTVTTDRT